MTSQVVSVSIQSNSFSELPEELLLGMDSLLYFYARYSTSLITLPEQFFWNQRQLLLIFFTESYKLGSQGTEGVNVFVCVCGACVRVHACACVHACYKQGAQDMEGVNAPGTAFSQPKIQCC